MNIVSFSVRRTYNVLKIGNIIAFIIMITVNFLAELLPINGVTTAEVSAKYKNLFTPAPYTFMIWGVIYLLLLGFVIYQLLDLVRGKNRTDIYVKKIGWFFIVACIANSLWLVAWHYDKIGLSLIFMLILLWSLIIIYTSLSKMYPYKNLSLIDKVFVKLPFSIYFAWIITATIANVTVFLVSIGWNALGLPDVFWLFFAIGLLLVISLTVFIKYKDYAFLLTIVWAVLGIVVARIGASTAETYNEVITSGIVNILNMLDL